MKILLSAYGCQPGRGSEPGVGWNCVRQAARTHDIWVLTQGACRQEIEAAFPSEGLPRTRFIYLDLPTWAWFFKDGPWGAQFYYYLWQLAGYFAGRRLHREIGFDLIHHITLGKYWAPSFLALLPVPFIWGPVGGGESSPRGFWWSFSLKGKVFELARDLARKVGEYDPFVRLTGRRATLGLATTEETAKRMRMLGCRRVSVFIQMGLPEEEVTRLSTIPVCHNGPFRLISIGRLLHWKGFELGVRAFARIHSQFPTSEYWIVGDGPGEKRLRRLARQLGVGEKVIFWGQLPRELAMEKLAMCDVLVHPSLHDSSPCVCVEAMAAARPVICLDLGGPAVQVTDETGIRVNAISQVQAVDGLAHGFARLASDSALRLRLGTSGRQRVKEHFHWDEKGRHLAKIYEDVVSSHA